MNSFVITRGASIFFGFLMYGIHMSLQVAFMTELISAQLTLIFANTTFFFLFDAFFRGFQSQGCLMMIRLRFMANKSLRRIKWWV
jgi:hypothetical protein